MESSEKPAEPSRKGARRFALPGLVVAAAVALLVLLVFGISNHTDTASLDAQVNSGHFPQAPDYTTDLPLLGSSKRTDLAAYKGKVLLVNMYASWCEPCRSEAPIMAREQKVLAAHGANLIGVTFMDNSTSTVHFNQQYGLHYPVLRDVSGTFVHAFGTFGVPETFVLNRRGRIVALSRGPVTQKWLNEHLKSALAEKA